MTTLSKITAVRTAVINLGIWMTISFVACGCTVTGNSNNVHASSTVFRW